MKIVIDKQTKVILLEAIKTGVLDTLKIQGLYGKEQLSFFHDLLVEANQVDDKSPEEQCNFLNNLSNNLNSN